MEYTESIKKEAEEVVEKYMEFGVRLDEMFLRLSYDEAIPAAIQDRQSVLDKFSKLYYHKCNAKTDTTEDIYKEIQFLTQQIEYLKSKI